METGDALGHPLHFRAKGGTGWNRFPGLMEVEAELSGPEKGAGWIYVKIVITPGAA